MAFLAWPFKSLWWGSATKVAAAVTATVFAFAVPEGFGLSVTDPEIGPVPDLSNFSYVTASGRVHLTDNPARDVGGARPPDCSRIAFSSTRERSIDFHGDIYSMNADGTNVVNLTRSPQDDHSTHLVSRRHSHRLCQRDYGKCRHLCDERRRHRPDQPHKSGRPQPYPSLFP